MALYDEDESFCDGDPSLDEIDWVAVLDLESRMAKAYSHPEGEDRSWAMLGLLEDLHGDELRVL